MFNLEQSILSWREEMVAAGLNSCDFLDELESHLRDDVEQQTRLGADAQRAFESALLQMGSPVALKNEFKKAREPFSQFMKRFIYNLLGITEPQLATGMNAPYPPPKFESALATYFKAASFALPAIFFWLLSALFVLPKVQQICQTAGTTVFHFDNAPLFFRTFTFISRAMVYLTEHGLLLCGVIIAALALLEWRSKIWPRYRRATFGIGAFLINTAVLIAITAMVISAVIAAGSLMPVTR